jgi:hypothetical protein
MDRYISYKKNRTHPDKYASAKNIRTILRPILEAQGFDVELIAAVIDPAEQDKLDQWNVLASQGIDSPLDADRMDYLIRDAHYSGLSVGSVGTESLIEHAVPYESEGAISLVYDEASKSSILHFIYARESMYLHCYETETKIAAEGMLVSGVRSFLDTVPLDLDDILVLTDSQLLELMMVSTEPDLPCHQIAKSLLLGQVFEEILPPVYLADSGTHEESGLNSNLSSECQSFIDMLTGKSFTAVQEKLFSWQNVIGGIAGLGGQEWKIAVVGPAPNAFHDLQVEDVKILLKDGRTVKDFHEVMPLVREVVEPLTKKRKWIRVFASRDLSDLELEKIRKSANDLFYA